MDSQHSPLNAIPLNEKPSNSGDEVRLIDEDATVLPSSRQEAKPLNDAETFNRFPNDPATRLLKRNDDENEVSIKSPWYHLRLWWLETVASFTILLSLIALSALLGLYSGRQRIEWPYFLSINAIVAALVTALRVAVLFIAVEGMRYVRLD